MSLGAGERGIEDADHVDVGERFDVVSVLRPNHIEGPRPQRVDFPGSPIGDLERAIKDGPKHEAKKPAPTATAAHLQDLEKTISRQLGLRVQLRAAAKKGKGRLVIHYASLDQFDELLARLKVSTE